MIDIANDNLDNELNIKKYMRKSTKYKNGGLVNLRTEEDVNFEKNMKYMENKQLQNNTGIQQKNYNPKELEYWRNIFPTKTDNELEEYRVKWSKENPNYLKFKNL